MSHKHRLGEVNCHNRSGRGYVRFLLPKELKARQKISKSDKEDNMFHMDILMLIRKATVTVSQQLDVMMDFAPFARRCKMKYCNNSIPSPFFEAPWKKFFDAYFRGAGECWQKLQMYLKMLQRRGIGRREDGGGGLWIKESAVAKHPYCVQMLPCTPQLTFLFCNYLSYHFYLFIFICLFISAMHPYYVQMMPCIPTLLPFSQLFSLVSPTFIIQDASVHN